MEAVNFCWVVGIAGILCIAALLISVFVDFFYKSEITNKSFYECGFRNFEAVYFVDDKQAIIPYFFTIEAILLFFIFTISMFVYGEIQMFKFSLSFFSCSIVVDMLYIKEKLFDLKKL